MNEWSLTGGITPSKQGRIVARRACSAHLDEMTDLDWQALADASLTRDADRARTAEHWHN